MGATRKGLAYATDHQRLSGGKKGDSLCIARQRATLSEDD
jgi:hypothetical protein